MSRPQILRNLVKDHLLAQIQNGELHAGKTINLAKFSRKIGVSVTPIREALSQLEHVGVIRAVRNKGFVVTQLSAKEARDLYEIMAQLEMMALESSTFSRKDLDVLRLQQLKIQQANTPMQSLISRFEFHNLLVCKSTNSILQQLLDNLRMRLLFYEHGFVEDDSFYGLINNQNEAIIQAIEEENLPTAALILKMNWMSVLEYVQSTITDG